VIEQKSKAKTISEQRLRETQHDRVNWKKWRPYLVERAWGTVRESQRHDSKDEQKKEVAHGILLSMLLIAF